MKLRRYLQIVSFKTYADLRAERSRTYLGFAWWFLEPLLLMGVFFVVFDLIMNRGGEGFVPFLLVGLVMWQWFRASVSHSSNSILQARGLVRDVALPFVIFPLVTVCSDSIKFGMVLAVLLVILWTLGYLPGVHYMALPVVLVTELLLITGVSFLLAALVPFVPDLRFIVDPLLQAVFFLSGVFYSIDKLAPEARGLILLNPMAGVIEAARDVLMDGAWPNLGYMAIVMLAGAAFTAGGVAAIRRLSHHYPKLPN